MTGQARVLIRNYGASVAVECVPCGINRPDTWPAATETAKAHNADHHPRHP